MEEGLLEPGRWDCDEPPSVSDSAAVQGEGHL